MRSLLYYSLPTVCPANATRVINTTDLLNAATTDPTNDDGVFENLLNTLPYWDISLRREWGSTDLPNQGNLTFNNVFVVTQFTTRGLVYRLNNAVTMRYVSKFMLTYSGEESGNFTTYPEVEVQYNSDTSSRPFYPGVHG